MNMKLYQSVHLSEVSRCAAFVVAAIACGMLLALLGGCDTNRGGELLSPLMFGPDEEADRQGEPNESIADATDLPASGDTTHYTLHRSGDVDYYRIEIDSLVVYQVRTVGVDEDVRTRIEIHDASDQRLRWDESDASTISTASIDWLPSSTGTFYLRVTSVDGSVGAYGIGWHSAIASP